MKPASFGSLAEKWASSVVSRSEVSRFSGGVLHPRTLANLDSLGKGPSGRIRVGRKVCYPVTELVNWMEARSTTPEPRKA
ncbi:MAG: hypothetical protein QMD09_09185 [Desulfatibacillaceae bacterium]|nr:hypothetical protein [Desulfatibacillaceae bacterium]